MKNLWLILLSLVLLSWAGSIINLMRMGATNALPMEQCKGGCFRCPPDFSGGGFTAGCWGPKLKGEIIAMTLNLDAVCLPSEDVVAREIEGELLIVPLVAGIGQANDELFTLNLTGQAIWTKLDGQRTLREVASLLTAEFSAPLPELENSVLGFASELTGRGILLA